MTENDYSGTKKDLEGHPIPNGKGGYFNHLQEMIDSYTSIIRVKRRLEGSLQNPNLNDSSRKLLVASLNKANFHINKINQLFDEFGGIEKWRKN